MNTFKNEKLNHICDMKSHVAGLNTMKEFIGLRRRESPESNPSEVRLRLPHMIEIKKTRRELKKKTKRSASADEVIYIFEKILEGWKTIKIYNTIIQNNHNSLVLKKNVENISTGNSKVYESELSEERYKYYTELREKVYEYHKKEKL